VNTPGPPGCQEPRLCYNMGTFQGAGFFPSIERLMMLGTFFCRGGREMRRREGYIAVRCSIELKDKLEELARKRQLSRSQLVRDILRKQLRELDTRR